MFVQARIFSNSIHIEQALCAARVWCERNRYKLSISQEKIEDPYYISAVIFVVNNKSFLVDCSDSDQMLSVYQHIDAYFKRSLRNHHSFDLDYPVHPFGFNYGLAYKPFSFKRLSSFQRDKLFLFRTLPIIRLFANNNYDLVDYRKMHAPPVDNGGSILLLTRLWDPSTVSSVEKKEYRVHLNKVRIDSIRSVKRAFSNRVVAGIQDSPLARELCPDLIIAASTTSKKAYLQLLRRADICIATNGLENTLGWRIGEYVAFSKAVLTEPFDINIPSWEEHEHYEEFDNDNLPKKIELLLKGRRYKEMQQSNYNYYNQFLEPGALFERMLMSVNAVD
jgi:hypothetical protein